MTIRDEYIRGTFELFKKVMSGDIAQQIIEEYERNPAEACARDALNLSKMMYYECENAQIVGK